MCDVRLRPPPVHVAAVLASPGEPNSPSRTGAARWRRSATRRVTRRGRTRRGRVPCRCPLTVPDVRPTTSRLPVHHPRSGAAVIGARRTPPSTVARRRWSPRAPPCGDRRRRRRGRCAVNRPCSTTNVSRRSRRYASTSDRDSVGGMHEEACCGLLNARASRPGSADLRRRCCSWAFVASTCSPADVLQDAACPTCGAARLLVGTAHAAPPAVPSATSRGDLRRAGRAIGRPAPRHVDRQRAGERPERDDERIDAHLDQFGCTGDQFVGIFTEIRPADRSKPDCVRIPAPPPATPPGIATSGTVALPGIQRRRTSSSRDSTWIPMASAPASRRSVMDREIGGRFALHLDGRVPGPRP